MPKSETQAKTKLNTRVADRNSVPTAAGSQPSTMLLSTTTETTDPTTSDLSKPTSSPEAAKSLVDTGASSQISAMAVSYTVPEGPNPLTVNIVKPTSSSDTSSTQQTLALHTHIGDIFAAPPFTVLIHACNTQGSWGAGIAAAFRTKYPVAYNIYRRHCQNTHNPRTNPVPTGSCLLIPPSETKPGTPRHWIVCLFTSAKYGKAKDKPTVILSNTGPAVKSMLQQIKDVVFSGENNDQRVAGLRMCKINSARFAVPWERTVAVLEGVVVEEGWVSDVEIWDVM